MTTTCTLKVYCVAIWRNPPATLSNDKQSIQFKKNWLKPMPRWAEVTAIPFDAWLSHVLDSRLPVTDYCLANFRQRSLLNKMGHFTRSLHPVCTHPLSCDLSHVTWPLFPGEKDSVSRYGGPGEGANRIQAIGALPEVGGEITRFHRKLLGSVQLWWPTGRA